MGSDTPTPPRRSLSVLIPFFNEAGNIQPLVDEVHAALAGIDYEIVCVNDASSDSTAAELVAAKALAPDRIKVLTHVKRRGKSGALFTGLRSCVGDSRLQPFETAVIAAGTAAANDTEGRIFVLGRH